MNFDDDKLKTCRLTIYVDRPEKMVSKEVRRRSRANGVNEETLSDVGHVFLGLTDENGVEKRIGFYGKMYAVGPENVGPEDQITGIRDLFKKVSGQLMDETDRRYHDAIQYNITPEQHKEAWEFIDEWREKDPKYILGANNCVSFALKTARKVGLRPPVQLLFGIPSPHGTSLAIQLKNKFDKITGKLGNIAKRISRWFGGKGNVIQIETPKFMKKPVKVVKETLEEVVSVATFGVVDGRNETVVVKEGVETERSNQMPRKNFNKNASAKKEQKNNINIVAQAKQRNSH